MDKQSFSESRFWKKLSKHGKRAGRKVVVKALQLYYIANSPDTPKPVKAAIYTTLLYFIMPIDAIPDPLPTGYIDDLGAIAALLATASDYLTKEIKRKADREAEKWIEKESAWKRVLERVGE